MHTLFISKTVRKVVGLTCLVTKSKQKAQHKNKAQESGNEATHCAPCKR